MLYSTMEIEDVPVHGKSICQDVDCPDSNSDTGEGSDDYLETHHLPASSRNRPAMKRRVSTIVPSLKDIVTIPREDVRYVVTEFGAVNLFGKSTQERAFALISIAHPEFRDELMEQAKELGMIGRERTLGESVYGIYPVKLEETVNKDGENIIFRPARPVDERRIQEHFYNLDKKDIISRFFHEKTSFLRDDVEIMSQIDYKRNLTIIALVGEIGFETVIGVGSYYMEPATNMAEVAFSMSRGYQSKGIGRIMMGKLASAAKDRGVKGLFAVTSLENKKMIKLFKSIPFKVETEVDEDMFLSCRFDNPLP
ncbi:MAG: GNAT family N-acetyltransferase [Desulfamplus sp.]|nr:GNAT family N-acetyltransferase [Desulfamplus sp.]